MAYTFSCTDCFQRDQEFKYWKRRKEAKRVAMAILTLNDTFSELEEDVNETREAFFACEEAYVLLSSSKQKAKQQTEA
jgi:hypothetical protein